MKLRKLVLALGVTTALFGMAHTAQAAEPMAKKITLTAQINDGIFVSKPDGSSWYATEELKAADRTQSKFSATLPVRVWTKNANFQVSLLSDLKLSNGNYEMKNAKVTFGSNAGPQDLTVASKKTITQVTTGNGGYDEVHDLTINVDAPAQVGTLSTNGSYSGDLVVVFEPGSAAGGGGGVAP